MLVQTAPEVESFLSWLGQRRFCLAFDTETTGLSWDAGLRLVQFGDSHMGWAIPWETHSELVKRVVRDYRGTIVAHGCKFDLHRLELAGLDVGPWLARTQDTDIIARVLWPSTLSFQLKSLAAQRLGITNDPQAALKKVMRGRPEAEIYKALRADLMEKEPAKVTRARAKELRQAEVYDWDTVPIATPEYVRYAVNDTVITAQLYAHQYAEMEEQSPWAWSVVDFEHDVNRVLYDMERRGMRVDPTYTGQLYRRWQYEREVAERKFAEVGIENPNSNAQVGAALQAHGWKPKSLTPTGKPKLDSDVLEELAETYPLARWLSEYKRLVKWSSAYVEHFLNERDTEDRIHASIKVIGARTSRMSVSSPPLQQLPSGDSVVRDCFVAGPGNVLVSVDYSQVEMRIAAHFAQEENLLSAIRGGEDLHSSTARLVYGREPNAVERKLAKVANFATLYGAGTKAVARQAGCSLKTARSFMQGFARAYPQLDRFMQRMEGVARNQGYITLEDGRRLPVDPGFAYRSTNYKVQGTAALVMKRALLRLRDCDLTEYALLPVHDEVLFECPTEEAQEVLRASECEMTDVGYLVPLTAEGTVCGSSWGVRYRKEEKAA